MHQCQMWYTSNDTDARSFVTGESVRPHFFGKAWKWWIENYVWNKEMRVILVSQPWFFFFFFELLLTFMHDVRYGWSEKSLWKASEAIITPPYGCSNHLLLARCSRVPLSWTIHNVPDERDQVVIWRDQYNRWCYVLITKTTEHVHNK